LKKIYHLIKENKLEKIIENFFSLSILQVAVYGFKFLTIPYITRVVGLEKFGLIAYAAALSNFFIMFVDYGFHLSAVKELAKNKNDYHKVNIIFSKVFFSKIILLLLSSFVFLLLVFNINDLKSNYLVYMFSFLVVINNVIYPQWFFHGIEKMKFITILNILIQILYIYSIFTYIKSESDYIYVPMFLGISTLFIGLISISIIFFKYKVRIVKIDFYDIIQNLNESKYIFINQFFPYLYNNSAIIILGIYAPLSNVGLYSAAERIINVCTLLIKTLSKSFFPHLSHSFKTFKLFSRSIILTSIIMFILLNLFAKPIYNILYPDDFKNGIYLLYMMSAGLFFIALYDCFGTNGLIHINQEKLLMKNTMFASISSFIFSFFFIYYFYAYGAVASVLMGRLFMGCGAYYFYKKLT